MKKTNYFASVRNLHEIQLCIDDVTKKRDAFIEKNSSLISDIDSEDVKVSATSSSGAYNVIVVLRLTYYPNNETK